MKKILIISMILLSACVHTQPVSPLPPTPVPVPVPKTLTAEEIGKKHSTIATGLEKVEENAAASKTAAGNIKNEIAVVAPTNTEIPKQAESIIEHSSKTKETVIILQKENSELRESGLVSADTIVRLKSDGEYLRGLLDQSKQINTENIEAIKRAKTLDMEEYKKRIDKERDETVALEKQKSDKIAKENVELLERNTTLSKTLENILGKIFIPFIAIGAILLAGGIGSFFGLFQLAGRKAFGLIGAGITMITFGVILPTIVNSVAKAIDPTLTRVIVIAIWLAFGSFVAYVGWLIWQRIRSQQKERELVQTAAVYKNYVEDTVTSAADGIDTVGELKNKVMSIQSAGTRDTVKRIRQIIGDKDGTPSPDIPDFMIPILITVFVIINGGIIWLGFFRG